MLPLYTEGMRGKEGALPLLLFLLAEIKARKSWCWMPSIMEKEAMTALSVHQPWSLQNAHKLVSPFLHSAASESPH